MTLGVLERNINGIALMGFSVAAHRCSQSASLFSSICCRHEQELV